MRARLHGKHKNQFFGVSLRPPHLRFFRGPTKLFLQLSASLGDQFLPSSDFLCFFGRGDDDDDDDDRSIFEASKYFIFLTRPKRNSFFVDFFQKFLACARTR